jgi:hypothetical protein
VPEKIGAGEARRFEFFDRFFLLIPITWACRAIFVLDALLDVSLDTPSPLNLARVPLRTRFRLYENPRNITGSACINNTAHPPKTLAPTTSRDSTCSQSTSLLATSFEFGIRLHPLFSYDDGVID